MHFIRIHLQAGQVALVAAMRTALSFVAPAFSLSYLAMADTAAATAAAPTPYVKIRYTDVMARILHSLVRGRHNTTDGWKMVVDVENDAGASSSGVRAALDRLAAMAVVDAAGEAHDAIEIRDHPTEVWIDRKTGRSYRRQEIRLTDPGLVWALDYTDKRIGGGNRRRASSPERAVTLRSTRLGVRATPA